VPTSQGISDLAVAVRFSDDSVMHGRYVYATYGSHDGGQSWKITEQFERPDSKAEISSSVDTGVVRVSSDVKNGIEVRTASSKTKTSFPKELPRRGSIAAADFVDQMNGWIVYQAPTCHKFQKPESFTHPTYPSRASLGPGTEGEKPTRQGLTCIEGATWNDLLTTTDGGNTLRVITPGPSSESLDSQDGH
jgi:hypothetical protein